MPVNKFEKQVKGRLDDFQLNPSAAVWKKVEEQIREKKRRRIIFFFILPVLIGLLGFSFYQFLYNGKKTELAKQSVEVKKENLLPGNEKKISVEIKEQAATGQLFEKDETKTVIRKEVTQTPKHSDKKKGNIQFLITNATTVSTGKPVTAKKNNRDNIQMNQDNSLVITSDIPAKQQITKIAKDPLVVIDAKNGIIKNEISEKKTQVAEVTIVEKSIAPVKTDSTAKEDIATADSKKEDIVKKKKLSAKIKWGIDLSAGIASNNKGTLSFAKALAFDNYSAGSITGPGSPSVIIPPSSVYSGTAFRIGVVAESQLSKRSSMSAGLQYAYSSNQMKVGAATDTSIRLQSNGNGFSSMADVNRLYRGTQKNNYTNSYHFIRLPLSWHLQINKGKKVPIQWNAGIAVSYLFTTNALVYSSSLGGIYYQDKKAFNKMHLDLGTGLSFRFKTKKSSEWVIGPELYFDMSRLVKNDNKQYLMFGGIHAKLFLPKKKNK